MQEGMVQPVQRLISENPESCVPCGQLQYCVMFTMLVEATRSVFQHTYTVAGSSVC